MFKVLGAVNYIISHLNQHYNIKGGRWSPYFCFMSKKNYAVGHAFSAKNLFMNFPVNKLKMTKEQCVKTYSDGNKRDLATSIFIRSVEMVVDDIIENNVHFKFPGLGRTQAYLHMNRTTGDKFKKAFRNGKWNDVDFITSNFSGNQLILNIESKKRTSRNKPVYLGAKDRDRITELTNNGKQY